MAILVESELDELTPGLQFDLERRVGRMYRKASDSVKKVRVKIANVKSPKGAMRKQCQLILTLVGAPSVMVVARKSSIEKAFSHALERANLALATRKNLSSEFCHDRITNMYVERGSIMV